MHENVEKKIRDKSKALENVEQKMKNKRKAVENVEQKMRNRNKTIYKNYLYLIVLMLMQSKIYNLTTNCATYHNLYIYLSKTYHQQNTFFHMSSKTQTAPLSRFYPYLGFDPYFWYQSSRNIDLFSKLKKAELIQQSHKNNVLVKVQETHEVDTQKPQIHSSESCLIVKKQAQSDDQNHFQCKQEEREQRQLNESNTSKRNETKNISKNFGKAILSFAKSNSKFAKKLLKRFNIEKHELIAYIKKARRNLNSLQDLRQMWGAGDEYDNMKKCLRIASYHFMRKHCLEYIFNSRIRSVSAHTKYRHRLMEGMSKPSQFTNIKVN